MSRIPPLPPDLSPAAAALWPGLATDLRAVTGGLARIDLLALEQLLRSLGRLAAVRDRIDADGLTVAGSQGQPRPHPLLAAEARLVKLVAAGFEQLRLTPRHREADIYVTRTGRLARE